MQLKIIRRAVWLASSYHVRGSRFTQRKGSFTEATAHRSSSLSTKQSKEEDASMMPRAAIAQLCSTADKFENLRNIAKCAGAARREGASMLFLPECCAFIGESAKQTLENAEALDDTAVNILLNSQQNIHKLHREEFRTELRTIINHFAEGSEDSKENNFKHHSSEGLDQSVVLDTPVILDGLRTIATESKLWISAGGIHEKVEDYNKFDGGRVYNTHIILNDKGKTVAKYRKIHLFDVSIPAQNIYLKESNTTAPGSELVACDSPLGKLGLTTCYDIRFPEQYTELTRNMGAEILLVPSAFTVPTGRAHWHVLLRSRAIETQCHVIAAAQYGSHNAKRISYGHSLAVDPWGQVLCDAGGMDSTDKITTPLIVTCDIDLSQTKSVRERMPIQSHRSKAKFTNGS